MKVPVIKKLVEQFSLAELSAAEEALLNEEKPDIDISGEDEGEKLTHAYAAVIIKKQIEEEGVPFATALRNYTSRVRQSIS
jgi:hypothetical protein